MPKFYPALHGFKSRARAYRATTNQAIANNIFTQVQLNAETYDGLDEFDSTTNFRFTAKKAGYYAVSAAIRLSASVDQQYLIAAIWKNGATYSNAAVITSGTSDPSAVISDIIYLDVNDYLELYAYHTCGTGISILYGSGYTFMAIQKLSE